MKTVVRQGICVCSLLARCPPYHRAKNKSKKTKTYNLRKPRQSGHERRRRIPRLVDAIQHQDKPELRPSVLVLEQPGQLDVQLCQRLAPHGSVWSPVQGVGNGRDDALEEVAGCDASRGGDDGMAECVRVVQGHVAKERCRDGRLAGGFDAVEREVPAWCCGGLQKSVLVFCEVVLLSVFEVRT